MALSVQRGVAEEDHVRQEAAGRRLRLGLADRLEVMGEASALAPRMRIVTGQTIADQDARIVVPQEAADDLLAAVIDGEERVLRRGKDPGKGVAAPQPPAGLIGVDRRTLAHGPDELDKRRLQLSGHPGQGVREPARSQAQPELAQHVARLPGRDPELFVEIGREAQRAGAQVRPGRPGRGRDLGGMGAAHRAAPRALADVRGKPQAMHTKLELLDHLLHRLHALDRPPALGALIQGHG